MLLKVTTKSLHYGGHKFYKYTLGKSQNKLTSKQQQKQVPEKGQGVLLVSRIVILPTMSKMFKIL